MSGPVWGALQRSRGALRERDRDQELHQGASAPREVIQPAERSLSWPSPDREESVQQKQGAQYGEGEQVWHYPESGDILQSWHFTLQMGVQGPGYLAHRPSDQVQILKNGQLSDLYPNKIDILWRSEQLKSKD